jgi:predicted dehydrogenase
MSAIIHYGVIGCGMMGQEHLRNIALLHEASVSAIFEPDPNMRAAAQAIVPEARFVNSIEDLLAVEALDCILIASPNFRHVEQLEQLAKTRPLPVLVEKPLFTAPSDLKRIDAFVESYPAPVWVAMEYRYMPPITEFLKAAQSVTGGVKMLTIREHRFPFLRKVGDWNRFNAQSGGTFVEKCCHFFDLMHLVLGSEPVRVMASGAQDVNHKDEDAAGGRPDIFDNGYVIVDFSCGARALLELCMFAEGARYQEEVSAVGPEGKIETFVPGPGRFWPEHLGDAPVPKLIVSPRNPKGPTEVDIPVDPLILDAGDHNGSTFYQHQKFLELVRGERSEAEVNIEDGKRAVLTGIAAQISMEEKRCVELAEIKDWSETNSVKLVR